MRVYAIIMTIFVVLLLVSFVILFVHAGYVDKILIKIGIKEKTIETDWSLVAWENCLQKLNYNADAAFLGDSLTRGSDFGRYFSKNIVNLGLAGDTLAGMYRRVSLVSAVAPKKVFLMGGVNSLSDANVEACIITYEKIISSLQKNLPDTKIYIQSLLPVSFEKETFASKTCHNTTIQSFNRGLEQLAEKYKVTYIDLFTDFLLNGEINPEYTKDGIHISEKGYEVWSEIIRPYITE